MYVVNYNLLAPISTWLLDAAMEDITHLLWHEIPCDNYTDAHFLLPAANNPSVKTTA